MSVQSAGTGRKAAFGLNFHIFFVSTKEKLTLTYKIVTDPRLLCALESGLNKKHFSRQNYQVYRPFGPCFLVTLLGALWASGIRDVQRMLLTERLVSKFYIKLPFMKNYVQKRVKMI